MYKWLDGFLGFLKKGAGEYRIHIYTLGSDTGTGTLGKGQILYQMVTRIWSVIMNTLVEKWLYLQVEVRQGGRIKSIWLDGKTKAEERLPQNNRDTWTGRGGQKRKQYLSLRHLIAKWEHKCAKH